MSERYSAAETAWEARERAWGNLVTLLALVFLIGVLAALGYAAYWLWEFIFTNPS